MCWETSVGRATCQKHAACLGNWPRKIDWWSSRESSCVTLASGIQTASPVHLNHCRSAPAHERGMLITWCMSWPRVKSNVGVTNCGRDVHTIRARLLLYFRIGRLGRVFIIYLARVLCLSSCRPVIFLSSCNIPVLLS